MPSIQEKINVLKKALINAKLQTEKVVLGEMILELKKEQLKNENK